MAIVILKHRAAAHIVAVKALAVVAGQRVIRLVKLENRVGTVKGPDRNLCRDTAVVGSMHHVVFGQRALAFLHQNAVAADIIQIIAADNHVFAAVFWVGAPAAVDGHAVAAHVVNLIVFDQDI